jgi:hypothetical protein
MRFLPTIDLWASGIQQAIQSGQIKLQVGQWVQCGQGEKSRYLGHTKHTFDCVHWQGSGKRTKALFTARIQIKRDCAERSRLINKVIDAEKELKEFNEKSFNRA